MAESSTPTAGKDVARPGSTPASATSKPVIVGHTSQVADPMMSSAAAKSSLETVKKAEEPAAKIEEPAKSVESESESESKTEAVPGGSSRPKITPSSSAEEAAQDQKDIAKAEESAAADEDAAAKEVDEKQARVQEIIETGEYNVSVGKGSGKSGFKTFFLTMLMIVLVGVSTLFVLTDLKILDMGIKLPFHIFKQ